MNTNRIAIAVTNDLSSDQRVHKVALAFYQQGIDVVLIGRMLPDSIDLNRPYKVIRFKLPFRKNFGFYSCYNIRLFFHLVFNRYNFYIANDLDTLPAIAMASFFTRKTLAIDYHELFTEMPELLQTPFQRKFWLILEKIFYRFSKVRYTVSKPIAAELEKRYNLPVSVIMNVPLPVNYNNFSTALSIPGKKIILYQGVLNIGRGLEMAIKSMHLIQNAILLIVGDGDIAEKLKNLTNNEKLNDKVIFTGKIPFEQLIPYTKSATIGISVEEDMGFNYRYALPNKLFDYIQANIPVLVSDLPEMKMIVEKYGTGEILKKRTDEGFALQVNQMLSDENKLNTYKANTIEAAKILNWEYEKQKLIDLFKKDFKI